MQRLLTVPYGFLDHHDLPILGLPLDQVFLASDHFNGLHKLVRDDGDAKEEPEEEQRPHDSQKPVWKKIDPVMRSG